MLKNFLLRSSNSNLLRQTTKTTSCSSGTINTSIFIHSNHNFASFQKPPSSALLNTSPTFCGSRCGMSETSLNNPSSSTEKIKKPDPPKYTNRLALEKSPYLLQHAHNPVDWYPWSEEAFELARRENKIIFLSVGYSTCHWCHVMEHESFENEEVAAIMNKNFVNIKVDREERPDIDKIYMQIVIMMNRSGGWPMSVWLTPDLKPISAGTYFPPKDRWAMPSFTSVITKIAEKWADNPEELKLTGHRITEEVREFLNEKKTESATFDEGFSYTKMEEAQRIYKRCYDIEYGGFGAHPKFPQVSRLNFLYHAYIVKKDADTVDMVLQTLNCMGKGGIHDHVFGGFSRYSVDRVWHIPHFEKMLYDQGQLMSAYATAYKLTRDEEFLRWADGIFQYVMKDLRHPNGGFYCGEDADSLPNEGDTQKVEGAFYAWKYIEIKAVVLSKAIAFKNMQPETLLEIYTHHYDIRTEGNIEPKSDPDFHLRGKNILIVRGSEMQTCEKYKITPAKLRKILSTINEALHEKRNTRPRPQLDTKIVTSWNGLMLTGLCKLANCNTSKKTEYLKAAENLYKFCKEYLFDAEKNILIRSCYGFSTDDKTIEFGDRIDGFLDDYAFLIKGLLDYYKASLDGNALTLAKQLQEIQDKLFWDSEQGAYFYSQENSPNVILRLKEDQDGSEPCGNSIAARNLILLSHYYDNDEYKERAKKIFIFFADPKIPFGYAFPEMLSAMMLYDLGLDLVAVVGSNADETNRFVQICRDYYIPGMIIIHVDPEQNQNEACATRMQNKFKMVDGKTTVYICHDHVCRLPVTDPEKLEATLKENYFRGLNNLTYK